MRRLLVLASLLLLVAGSQAPADPDSPAAAVQAVVQALQSDHPASCWVWLTVASQNGLVNVYSHVAIEPVDQARQDLLGAGPNVVAFWRQVRSLVRLPASSTQVAISTSGPTVVVQSGATRCTLGVVNQGGWKVQLLESALSNWLAATPYVPPSAGAQPATTPAAQPSATPAQRSTTQVATQFLQVWASADYETSWSLLSARSQLGLVNSFSHAMAVPQQMAGEWLTSDDPEAVAFWDMVRKTVNLPVTGLVYERQSTGSSATVVFSDQTTHWALMEVNEKGWKVELLESVMPSWLAVQPFVGTSSSDDDPIVVGENPAMSDPPEDPFPREGNTTDWGRFHLP